MKCDRCGRFRKAVDLIRSEHGDGHDAALVTECRWCMSPVDAARLTSEPDVSEEER